VINLIIVFFSIVILKQTVRGCSQRMNELQLALSTDLLLPLFIYSHVFKHRLCLHLLFEVLRVSDSVAVHVTIFHRESLL
jgi:hypothetical protein